jgi:hypothetical protein
MKLKSELARASMTTSNVNNQWRSKRTLYLYIRHFDELLNKSFIYCFSWSNIRRFIKIQQTTVYNYITMVTPNITETSTKQ